MKIASSSSLQTNNFTSSGLPSAQLGVALNSNALQTQDKNQPTYLNIAKNTSSVMSFLLASLEVVFGFLQNTTISRIFALTSSAEAVGAASLNLPHSDKIMAFVQFAIGSLIASEIVLPKKDQSNPNSFLNKIAKSSKERFKGFAKKVNIPETKLLNGMRFALPVLGLTMAISKKLISHYSTNPSDKEAFDRSSIIDTLCFLESMLLFVPKKFEHLLELPYKIIASAKLLSDSIPALLGLTSVSGNKN